MAVNCKMKAHKIPQAKRWYNIKLDTEPRWIAYELSPAELKEISHSYKIRGPFKSLMHCLIASSS